MTENLITPLSRSRYRGCLLGLAVGDAIGTTVEFMPRGSFTPLTDMVGGGPFQLEPGEWTDDTSMALCLADSLVTCGDFDPVDQLERYVKWWRNGYLSSNGRCFDIGMTISGALRRFENTHKPYPGDDDSFSAGNGSLMRLAPVPMFYANTPELAVSRSADASRTTHATAAAVDACRYFGALIVMALHGFPKYRLLAPISAWQELGADSRIVPDGLAPEVMEVANGSYRDKMPPEIKGSGYVIEAMEAALWAFQGSETFEEGVLLAANLGDDADTTAAIYGQLAGAYYGVEWIPGKWIARLAKAQMIIEYADRLWVSATRG